MIEREMGRDWEREIGGGEREMGGDWEREIGGGG